MLGYPDVSSSFVSVSASTAVVYLLVLGWGNYDDGDGDGGDVDVKAAMMTVCANSILRLLLPPAFYRVFSRCPGDTFDQN